MSEEVNKEDTSPAPSADTSVGTGEESFAKLFEESESRSGRLRPGEKVNATVISISSELVYIDIGGKSEGAVNLSEFLDDDGNVTVKIGDEIQAYYTTTADGVMRLSTLIHGYSPAKLSAIRDAQEAGMAISGEVRREVKGGFEVSVGGVRCFCPYSHIDLKGGREGGVFLGRTFAFRILEFEEEGKNVILSRRLLLEEERKEKIEELKGSLKVGDEVKGRVRSVQKFGAFVELGGVVDALIPVSELSWERVNDPRKVINPGDEVTAKVIGLDWDKNRLTLSLKATQPDPWVGIASRYPVDEQTRGTVVRLESFGAFVNLEPGVDGLIHLSNLGAGRKVNHPKEVLEVGQLVEPYVTDADEANRRISLALQPRFRPEKIPLPALNEVVDGVVEKVMPYGIFVKMPSGLTGLVPNAEMGTPRGTDHSKMFPVGTALQTAVVEVDTAHHRVKLSRKSLVETKEKQEYREYMKAAQNDEDKPSDMGSLGVLLKAKMEEQKNAASQ